MLETIRDAPFGQAVRFLTRNKVFLYPEERPDFVVPECYQKGGYKTPPSNEKASEAGAVAAQPEPTRAPVAPTRAATPPVPKDKEHNSGSSLEDLEKFPTADANQGPHYEAIKTTASRRSNISRHASRQDLEESLSMAIAEKGPSRPIIPTRTEEGVILVDWYTTDDSENPQNWLLAKKLYATFIICIYTLSVYMGSSIYAPAVGGVIADFGISGQVASLGLSMYVLAYGLGPMIFSPLSEIPAIGRNPPYIITFFLFVVLTIPAGFVTNYPGLVVLRFLQGFFGSPCLATGGASLQDMFNLLYMPFLIATWALAATCGPALGPIISGFSVGPLGWQWSMWEILFLAGPTFLAFLFFMPETNGATILYHRAARLRKITGNEMLKAQSEIDSANMSVVGLVLENLYRPLQMMLLDPAVGFTALYTALIYGIYYSFFESFPLVYVDIYGFTLGEQGLAFLSISVGVVAALAIYCSYLYWSVVPFMKKNGFGAPERRLVPALISTWLLPVGLFIFGWTARESIHWIVPTIGITLFTLGIFIVIQCIFVFLPLTYPQYAASLFAGNDLVRSALACGAIHFSTPLFHNLGLGRGISILGGCTAGCIIGLYALWYYGAALRARSKFAAKY